MRQHQPPVAYFPLARPLQQQRPPSTSQLSDSTQPMRQMYGLKFHPPGTTAVSGEINCLLPPPAGGSLRQNPGKIEYLNQPVPKVVFAPACFWECGARFFAVRLCVWERPVTICSVFRRIDDSGFKNLQDETNRLRHTYCGQSIFLRYGSFKNVMSSKTARGYRS